MTRTMPEMARMLLLELLTMKFYIFDLYLSTGWFPGDDEGPAQLSLYANNLVDAKYIIETELLAVGGELFNGNGMYVTYEVKSINAPDLGMEARVPKNTIEVITADGSVYRKDFRRNLGS